MDVNLIIRWKCLRVSPLASSVTSCSYRLKQGTQKSQLTWDYEDLAPQSGNPGNHALTLTIYCINLHSLPV
jgi:hypothetical protein